MTTGVVADDIAAILSDPLDWSMLSGRTVLVTGATGMIGQYVVRALAELGRRTEPIRVLALTRRAQRARRLFSDARGSGAVEIVDQDVTARLTVSGPLHHVVHAASPADPVSFREDPVGVIRANVSGTDNLLSLASAHGATLCLLSTLEVYGRLPATTGRLREDAVGTLDSLDLRAAYPLSKRMAEHLCVAYRAQHGVPYRIARLSHTYGPGMRVTDPRVQAYFLRQALSGQDIVLQSVGSLRRTYTYVSDAVRALFYLMCADEDLTCNVANESAVVSLRELADLTLRYGDPTGRAIVRTETAQQAPGAPTDGVLLDCGRLRALGWSPRVDLVTGIGRWVTHERTLAGRPHGKEDVAWTC